MILPFKVVGVFRGGGNSFHNLMIRMNGPRVIWQRLPQFTLGIFIIFKNTKVHSMEDFTNQEILPHPEYPDEDFRRVSKLSENIILIVHFTLYVARIFWMVAEQILLSRHTQASPPGGSDAEQFVNWSFCKKARKQGKQ